MDTVVTSSIAKHVPVDGRSFEYCQAAPGQPSKVPESMPHCEILNEILEC